MTLAVFNTNHVPQDGKIVLEHRDSKENAGLLGDPENPSTELLKIKGTCITFPVLPSSSNTKSSRTLKINDLTKEVLPSFEGFHFLLQTNHDYRNLEALKKEAKSSPSLQEWLVSFEFHHPVQRALKTQFKGTSLEKHGEEAALLIARMFHPNFSYLNKLHESGVEVKTKNLTAIKLSSTEVLIYQKKAPLLGNGGLKKVIPAVYIFFDKGDLGVLPVAMGKAQTEFGLLQNNYDHLCKCSIDGMLPLYHTGIYLSEKRSDLEKKEAVSNPKFLIAMEFCQEGDVKKTLEERKIPQEKKLEIGKRLLQIVNNFHKAGIAHRDIKLENFLMDNEDLYLGDLDFSCRLSESSVRRAGTFDHAAPEIRPYLNQGGSSNTTKEELLAIDYWALGICLCDLFCESYPTLPETETIKKDSVELENKRMSLAIDGFFLKQEDALRQFHPNLPLILKNLLENHPKDRSLSLDLLD